MVIQKKLPRLYRKGFTLLELLIVISIIGVLTAFSLASYITAQKKTRDSRRIGELKAIQQALEQYNADNNGIYPTNGYDHLGATYFPGSIPKDPKTSCFYMQTKNDADGYTICADLEGVGSFTCSSTCDDVKGAGCTDVADFCIKNLQ